MTSKFRPRALCFLAMGLLSGLAFAETKPVIAPTPIPKSPANSGQPTAVQPSPSLRVNNGLMQPQPATGTAPGPAPSPQPKSVAPKPPPKKINKVIAKKVAPPTVKPAQDSLSSEERAGLVLGLISGRVFGFGAEFYYPLDFGQIGIGYWLGQGIQKPEFADKNDFSVGGGKAVVQSINLTYLYDFWQQLIVPKGGVGFRSIRWTYSLSGEGSTAAAAIDANSLCVNLALGSYWTVIPKLAIGIDWFGASIPVFSQSSSTLSTTGGFEPSLNQLSADAARLGKTTSQSYSIQLFLVSASYFL